MPSPANNLIACVQVISPPLRLLCWIRRPRSCLPRSVVRVMLRRLISLRRSGQADRFSSHSSMQPRLMRGLSRCLPGSTIIQKHGPAIFRPIMIADSGRDVGSRKTPADSRDISAMTVLSRIGLPRAINVLVPAVFAASPIPHSATDYRLL